MNSPPRPLSARLLIATGYLGMATVLVMAVLARDNPAQALSSPLQGGKNTRVLVTQTLTRVASTGQKCAVTLANIDVYYKQFPVFTGYGQYDGGPITGSGIPICDGTLTTVAACPSTTLVRDAAPGAVFLQGLVGFIPDGGIPVRVELATGCVP